MNLLLLALVSIAGPMAASTSIAEEPARAECPVANAEAKTPAKAPEKITAQDPKTAGRSAPLAAKKPAEPAIGGRKPRHPAYLFM